MNMPNDDDPKRTALAQHGVLHPHPEQVADELFAVGTFFDPRDLVQVKYEMLRRVRTDGHRVSHACRSFGLSRPTYYEALGAFERGGLPGLLPAKKGPRRAHKLSETVMAYVDEQMAAEPSLSPEQLVQRIQERFELTVHSRSVVRALARRGKKKP